MKSLIYKLYAFIFNLSSVFVRPNKNYAALISAHNEDFSDSLGAVFGYCNKNIPNLKFLKISRRDIVLENGIIKALNAIFIQPLKLAKAKYIFLNDNFMPLGFMKFKADVKIVQLWHGEGAFKKFGLSIEQPANIRKTEIAANSKLSCIVATSKAVVPFWAEAFGVEEKKVLPLGSPRTDYFFESEQLQKAKAELILAYPQLKNKKIVLYAPTFRVTDEENQNLLSHFDFNAFNEQMGNEYALCVRLHPQIHSSAALPPWVPDLTNWKNPLSLLAGIDVLITDYSSICMNFALMGKKCVFFAFDLEKYASSRDFYFDYSTVPGQIAKTTQEVIDAIKADIDTKKLNDFVKLNFDHAEGGNSKRVVEFVMGKQDE